MRKQRGFGAIAAIVVLVILAGMAATLIAVSTTQHITSAQDFQGARAWQAARAGNEWGLYRALQDGVCDNTTLDLRSTTGFYVTVSCFSPSPRTNELGYERVFYEVTAVACPSSTCPSTTPATIASPGYVERRRVVTVEDSAD